MWGRIETSRRIKNNALAEVAIKYAEAGQYYQALQIAKAFKSSLLKANTLAEIALKYAETGQKVIERNILYEIIKELE